MKTKQSIIIYVLFLLIMIGISSCSETEYKSFDTMNSNIYFEKDSITYSFGTTPYSVMTYTLKVPVKILGIPSPQKRTFRVEIVTDKTNAEADIHYRLPDELTFEPDSVNSVIPLEILRKDLGSDKQWQIGFKLLANDYFIPAKEIGDQTVIVFNNIVEPPTWTDWMGNQTWPYETLGAWNPRVWVTFMEYFRKMETTNPSTYQKMVEQYGPNLEHVTYGWPFDFEITVKKYILIPMYDYFQLHPELGVEMPDPNAM